MSLVIRYEKAICIFYVKDGIDIAKEDFEKVFIRFQPAAVSIENHYGGTGLVIGTTFQFTIEKI